jgi:hypothetical protein
MSKPKRNAPCPCGSDRKYKHCCLNKEFEKPNEDDHSHTAEFSLDDRMRNATARLRESFEHHFDRPPSEGDPMFLGKYLLADDDIEHNIVAAMEAVGTDPSRIYAYKKTGYIIVEENLNRYSGTAIDEWDAAIAEYDAHRGAPSNPEADVFDNTLITLAGEFESLIYALGLANDNFFNTDLLHDDSESSASILTPRQYQALCISKVHRTLRSVRLLEENRMSEDILKLARTIYESYLHVIYIQRHPEAMECLVDAVVGLRKGTHEYKKRRDGSDDRRCVVELATGKEFLSQVSSYKMAEASRFEEDLPFFDFFYRTTSELLHPTVFALDAYVSSNGLDPVKPHMHEEAIIFTACVSAMVVDSVRSLSGCPERVARDCSTVVKRVRADLLTLLDQLGVWKERLGATNTEISIVRSRSLRLGEV